MMLSLPTRKIIQLSSAQHLLHGKYMAMNHNCSFVQLCLLGKVCDAFVLTEVLPTSMTICIFLMSFQMRKIYLQTSPQELN